MTHQPRSVKFPHPDLARHLAVKNQQEYQRNVVGRCRIGGRIKVLIEFVVMIAIIFGWRKKRLGLVIGSRMGRICCGEGIPPRMMRIISQHK